jgi:glycosyltransferase involved in cell wall biosynthesis
VTPEPDIVILTDYSSPYQVELFDLVEELAPGRIEVFYRTRTSHARGWAQPELKHRHHTLDTGPDVMTLAAERFTNAKLAVFNFYTDARALDLINGRAALNKPWAFWGERPGYVSPTYGRFFRLWALRALHRSRAPIWGIGQIAIDRYREEFGAHRRYVNLPYFSNLQRFKDQASRRLAPGGDSRVILYSGSLIPRKGVDLLAKAFAGLKASGLAPNVQLKILGRGPLEKSMKHSLKGCMDSVEFLGFRDWSDLPQEYAKAHILCAPSRHDGWGLIVPEGLASGLPVISTSSTGSAFDLIEDGKNGWTVPANSEEQLLTALKTAATMPASKLREMSNSALASVEPFTLFNGARRFLQAADDAVSGW